MIVWKKENREKKKRQRKILGVRSMQKGTTV